MKRALVLGLGLAAGCASGSNPLGGQDGNLQPDTSIDARRPIDAGIDTEIPQPDVGIDTPIGVDAAPDVMVTIDAHPDAMHIDAMPDAMHVDAMPDACVPMQTQLLLNPAFDLAPVGVDWTEVLIDPAAPLITSDNTPQSAPYLAWLGGIYGDQEGGGSVTDQLYQDVTIPAGTTQLTITGYYANLTDETGATVYDTCDLGLIHTSGTPIETALHLTNAVTTGTYTPFTYTFSTGPTLVGQTVRFRMTSTNDFSNATSFFFDTLALTATHCP
ncbi:MAG TPA: hypothetical protein VGM88_06135 [Kofleriaceae bacterium]